jgi:hypothetical protein
VGASLILIQMTSTNCRMFTGPFEHKVATRRRDLSTIKKKMGLKFIRGKIINREIQKSLKNPISKRVNRPIP